MNTYETFVEGIANDNEKKVICTYDDFIVFEENGKLYFYSEDEELHELVLVKSIYLGYDSKIDEMKLFNPDFDEYFDVTGELDEEPIYCYWKYVD